MKRVRAAGKEVRTTTKIRRENEGAENGANERLVIVAWEYEPFARGEPGEFARARGLARNKQ